MGLLGALGDTWACMYYGLKLASYMVMVLESFTIVCLYREAILFAIIVMIIICYAHAQYRVLLHAHMNVTTFIDLLIKLLTGGKGYGSVKRHFYA